MRKPEWLEKKESGDQYKKLGNTEAALACYREAIKFRPQYAAAHFEIGALLLLRGENHEALGEYAKAWIYSRFANEPALMIGRIFLLENMSADSVSIFEKIPRQKFDSLSALFFCEALRLEDRLDEANDLVALFDGLNDPRRHSVLGALYLDLDMLDMSEYHLSHAKSYSHGFVYDKLIGLYLRLKKYRSLDETINEAIEKFPDNYFYKAMRDALRVYRTESGYAIVNQENPHHHHIEAANYFRSICQPMPELLGTTYETIDFASRLVPSEGVILEFGVRNGNTIRRLAKNFPTRRIYGFDSFQGLPTAWGEEEQGSYSTNGRLPAVPSNVFLITGSFEETLQTFKLSEKIALINIDCDLYESTKVIFDHLGKNISGDCLIIFDEYIGNPSWKADEFRAFKEWVLENAIAYKYLSVSPYSKQVVVKILGTQK